MPYNDYVLPSTKYCYRKVLPYIFLGEIIWIRVFRVSIKKFPATISTPIASKLLSQSSHSFTKQFLQTTLKNYYYKQPCSLANTN